MNKTLLNYIPKVLFFSFIIKDLVSKPDWPSAVTTLGLCGVFVFCEYFVQNAAIKELYNKLDLQNKKIEELHNKCGLLGDSIGAIQISNRFKSMK